MTTIKYYLREGLLPVGEQTSPTQARYDGRHVQRLRLVRALVDVGGLSISAVRRVLSRLDSDDLHEVLGQVQQELPPQVDPTADPELAVRVAASRGWRVHPQGAATGQLATALAALRTVDMDLDVEQLDVYARAAEMVARREVAQLPGDPEAAVAHATIGTVLYEPVLLALRRMAHEHLSAAGREPCA